MQFTKQSIIDTAEHEVEAAGENISLLISVET